MAVDRSIPDWLNVSRETIAKLGDFLDLVEKWNPKINLISANSLPSAWSRHVLDSAQLWPLRQMSGGTWLDIGSGGGFPGVVVSILAQDVSPELQMVMVEADLRKAVFLGEVVRKLKLNAIVHSKRIESLPPVAAQTVSARALAALPDLLPMVSRHMAPEGVALFHKGQRHQDELAQSKAGWSFHSDVVASRTDPGGAIVKISELRRV